MFFTRKPSLIVHSTFSTLRPSEVMVIPSPHPNPNTLTHIDITKLTQSELYTLSLLSTLPSPSPTLSPTLNPSIFNSSLATRRQTFSRPSSSTKPHQSTTRLPKKLPPLLQTPTQNDPDYNHNKIIISLLKNLIKNENPDGIIVNSFIVEGNFDQLFSKNSNFTGEKKRKKKIHNTPDGNFVNSLTPTSHFNELSPKNDVKKRKKKVYNDGKLVNSELLEGEFVKKRKKVRESSSEVVIEIVNKNGVVVDIDQLSNKVDPFGEELRKRTNGMVSEEECLVFLRDLGGQWGSRRKKRKIVSACDFGGTFPVGWKLILGLRRKEGRVSVYIRRYIRLLFTMCLLYILC